MPDMDEVCAQWKRDCEIQYYNDKMTILEKRNKKKKAKENKMYKIETYDSKDGPRFRIIASNGKIIAHSEAYKTKGSRSRTVNILEKDHKFKVVEE